jgi:D-alanyl-D-alanine carboxypeptidase
MLKCIAVASANDACVAMSEYISGSEEAFVEQMNVRAKGLGMEHTHFVNCNGLDADGHLTTAYDIALMSRELITKHPEIEKYSMIWMENITHKTNKGTSEFGLSNTNKLVRHYPYATGLKTGSTSKAKFCISATARKDGMDLIAVIMAAPDSKMRVKDATTLLNYGFGKCTKYVDKEKGGLKAVKVDGGTKEKVRIEPEAIFQYVDTTGANLSEIQKKLVLKKGLSAPLKKGTTVGKLVYTLQEETIGTVPVRTTEKIDKITYGHVLKKVLKSFWL